MHRVKEDVESFVQRLQQAAGANLISLMLYGSAAREDFHEKYSDVNLLCVVRDIGGPALNQLAPVVHWWSKEMRHRPPLFVTAEELKTSADVFAIETLDLKANHRLLAGRDVLSDLEVPMNLHRVQLEHELRTVLMRLRHHYLLAPGDEHELEKVLAKSISSVMVLLRHALIAVEHPQVPESKRDVLVAIAKVFGIDTAALHAVLDLREGRRIQTGTGTLYQAYMECVAEMTSQVDRMELKLAPK
jgi:hypothetical protein